MNFKFWAQFISQSEMSFRNRVKNLKFILDSMNHLPTSQALSAHDTQMHLLLTQLSDRHTRNLSYLSRNRSYFLLPMMDLFCMLISFIGLVTTCLIRDEGWAEFVNFSTIFSSNNILYQYSIHSSIGSYRVVHIYY